MDQAAASSLTTNLGHGCEDGRVYLSKKQDSRRDFLEPNVSGELGFQSTNSYHILSQLQILGEVHAMFDRVVAVAFDHHIGNRLPGPCIPGNQFGNDV